MFDDKGTLYTDQTSFPTVNAAYAFAERIFDPNDQPTQIQPDQFDDLYGKSGLSQVKSVFHQLRQMETAFRDWDNPATMVQNAYTDEAALGGTPPAWNPVNDVN
jgi:hypothetical protein